MDEPTRGGPAEPSIKGAVVRELLLWYAREHEGGEARLRAIAEELAPPLLAHVRLDAPGLGIVASSWYPAVLCHEVLDGIVAGLSAEERTKLIQDGTDVVATRMMGGLYKLLFAIVASPTRYARHVGRAWRQLHSTGERYMAITSPGRAESTILDWDGHHPVLCEITTETMTVLFRRMGCRDVCCQRLACVSDGARDCRVLLSWTP